MSADDLHLFRPRGPVYLSAPLDAPAPPAEPDPFWDGSDDFDSGGYLSPGARVQRVVDLFAADLDALDYLLLLTAARTFASGARGHHASLRGIYEQFRRWQRNAAGFVPGAHPAARPMHEAYRARRRRRSGRR